MTGLGNSFINLGRIAGPIWAGHIFDVDVRYPYLTAAAIMFTRFVASLFLLSTPRQETGKEGAEPAAG